MALERVILVLVVEDNRDDLEIITEILKIIGDSGITVFFARSIAEAIAVINREKLDLILLDLDLPDSRGLDTLKAVKVVAPDTPVVVMSALSDRETAIAAIRLGAQEYINKQYLLSPRSFMRVVLFSIERERIRTELRKKQEALERELAALYALIEKPFESDAQQRLRKVADKIKDKIAEAG